MTVAAIPSASKLVLAWPGIFLMVSLVLSTIAGSLLEGMSQEIVIRRKESSNRCSVFMEYPTAPYALPKLFSNKFEKGKP